MFDQIVHFAGLALFGAAWLLVAGWAMRAAIRHLGPRPRPRVAPLASIRA
jgi:hypothetical protein